LRRSKFGAASLFAVALPAVALAADEAAVADAPSPLEEVVVTGEKSGRSLQDTPASVAVITAKRIDDEKIVGLFDVLDRTANVSQTYGPSGFTIRGINSTGVSGGGSGALATVYVDGAPLPERHLNVSPIDMWDVAQVEVLRGPQSTLQGRNALAGAIVIRTQDPTFHWTGRARVQLTDADERIFSAAGGGAIIADQLAFRLSVEDRKSDGFIYNTTRQADEAPLDATTFRGKLLLTPDAIPGLRSRLVWTHDERDGGYIFTYGRTDIPDPYDRLSNGDTPNTSKGKTDIVALENDYRLSERLTLNAVTSWNRVDTQRTYDGDNEPANISYGFQDEYDRTFSQEVRVNYAGERLSGLLGGYYAKRKRDYATASVTNVPTPVATLAGVLQGAPFGLPAATAQAVAALYAQALPNISVDYDAATDETVTTYALFADGRFQITPQLSLLAGFRYDRETNDQFNTQTAAFAGTYPNPASFGAALAPVIGGLNQVVGLFVAQAGGAAPPSKRTFNAFLPKAGLKYDFNEDASLSLVVQRGYRSGGSSVNIARSAVVPYDPEYTWNYELALRSEWLDDTLVLNANAYYVRWTDQQVNVNLGLNLYDYQTENAGRSHLYGFEIESQYRPTAHFDAYASLGYSRTEFDDFEVDTGAATLDLAGTEFAYAPHWTWAVGANYRWDNGLSANVNANYRAKAFADTGANQSIYAIKSRIVVNAKFAYAYEAWELAVFGRNLFDEEYFQYNNVSADRAIIGDPRVLGVSLEARW